ncbi:MAG: hypothetical protein KC731_27205, partial [Myxococcales bacterium]|nr:hypothetical protein [Myxococcales bacterium]
MSDETQTSDLIGAVHGIDLERHAAVSAEIAEAKQSQGEILAAHGIEEAHWNEASTELMRRLGEEVMEKGAQAMAPHRYSAAFAAAQDRLAEVVKMEPEDWARLTVEIQRAGSPTAALASRQLSQADYIRLGRHFSRLFVADPEAHDR